MEEGETERGASCLFVALTLLVIVRPIQQSRAIASEAQQPNKEHRTHSTPSGINLHYRAGGRGSEGGNEDNAISFANPAPKFG